MTWDDAQAYQALQARDPRFDGRLFVGVTSTGIYCRPICRVRLPKACNCRFFSSAAQAEEAGFRPCLKCRPELAPCAESPWSVMDASQTLALQAARLLDESLAQDTLGEPASPAIARCARRLGVSERHLRRIFARHHGVSPVQYLQTQRLLLAKRLLTDSTLSMAQVARSSGFHSLRRFNAAFSRAYRLTPGTLRREGRSAAAGQPQPPPAEIVLRLAYRPPYAVEHLMSFLATRALTGVEQVDVGEARVRRSLRLPGEREPGWLEARFVPLKHQVILRFPLAWSGHCATVVQLARRWLDLDAQPQVIDEHLAALPGPPGLRLPGAADPFETAVRALLGQRVTVAAARTLAARLVQAYGDAVPTPWADIDRLFPDAQRLGRVRPQALAALGLHATQALAVQSLARRWPSLCALAQDVWTGTAHTEDLSAALQDIHGVGPWSAQYILMRWLSWPDAHLPADVAVLKALGLPHTRQGHRHAQDELNRYQPWRAYAVMRLWNALETRS